MPDTLPHYRLNVIYIMLRLVIAALSFFPGQQQVFPEAIRKTHLLNAPIIIIAASMIFWLFRVRFTNAYKKA